MYRQRFLSRAAVVAAASMVGSLSASAAPPADRHHPGAPLLVFSANTGVMLACRSSNVPSGGPPDNRIIWTIRAVIPSDYDPAAPERDVSYKAYVPNEGSRDDSGASGTPLPDDPNPFHMDVTGLVPAQTPAGDTVYAEVRLILKDTDYSFYNLQGITGVGFGDENNNLGFCGAQFDESTDVTPHHPVSVFFIPLNKKGKNGNAGIFNFGLIPSAAPDTPIFIDPKVINNG